MGVSRIWKNLKQKLPVLRYNTVFLAPDRVDEAYDPTPFTQGKDYVRLWLTDAQYPLVGNENGAGYLIFSRVQFLYGAKRVAVPAFIGPATMRSRGPADTPPVRFAINRSLTPLFPYCGGRLDLLGGLVRIERDETGFSRVMESLAAALTSPRFSRLLEVSDILWDAIQSRIRDHAQLDFLFQQTLGQSAGTGSALAPGYLLVMKNAPSASTSNGVDEKSLRVVNGNLRIASPDNFESSRSPTDGELEYLLFRIEKHTERDDWASFEGINNLVGQAVDAARQSDSALVQEVFKRTTLEVLRSNDLTDVDKKRIVEVVRERVQQVTDIHVWPDRGSESPPQPSGSNALTKLGTGMSADLENDQKLRQAAIEAAAGSPFPVQSDESVLAIEYKLGAPLRIDITEGAFGVVTGSKNLCLDVSGYARESDQAFSGDWRFNIKRQGEHLLNELFDPVVWETYKELLRGPERNLHLRFRSPLDLLRVPLEFLPTQNKRDYLVLRHPFCRSVIGLDVPITKRFPPSKGFFNELYRAGENLSILLIASNTPPDIPRVDHEIESLFISLPELFKKKRIDVRIKRLMSGEATLENVKRELKAGQHHIIHYAGHGTYDSSAPEESYLPFWESNGRKGGVKQLKVPELKWALEESTVVFVYLSCCVGVGQAELMKLQDSDFLGITDGLLQAGVPSILGYRWPVVDAGSEKLAVAFYKFLAQEGEIDTALLLARREVSQDRQDRSWLSPVLILQA